LTRHRAQGLLCLFALVCAVTTLLCGIAVATAAEATPAKGEIVFLADTVTYEGEARIVTANGNVQARRGERTLRADHVRYDQGADRVTASGNVTLFEPGGEILFADDVELSGDLKDGIIDNFRAILADGARLAAARAERAAGVVTTAYRAVYSPCAPCLEDPDRPLLWQVKAVKVVHHQQDKIIEFYESQLEIGDVPVLWLPYFYAPDPTVKRKTGFLIPTFGASEELGLVAQIPYFIVISPEQDATITPWFMSKEGVLLEGQYRAALAHGDVRANGMITRDSRNKTRGLIDSRVRYDIDETWRAGLTALRTTDSAFPRVYDNDNRSTFTSRAFAESFSERNYFVANTYAFQGLATNDKQDTIPFAAPWLDYFYRSRPDALGGITQMRLDALALTREDGTDTRRLSARGGWHVPTVGPFGDIYTASATLWADGYNVSNLDVGASDNRFSGSRGRLFPQVGLSWRLPLLRAGETTTQILEPRAEIIAAPNYGNPSRIPDEDSGNFQFDYSNVFGMSRETGLDRVEKGPRVNYGLNWQLHGDRMGLISAFVGQTYRFREDNSFPRGSGLDRNISDIVSAVQLSPVSYLDLLYSNRLDNSSLEPQRQELSTTFGVDAIRVDATYVKFDGDSQEDLQFREELTFGLNTRLSRYWRSRVFGTRDIDSDSWRFLGLRVIYEDECFFFSTEFKQRNIDDRRVEPSNSIFFRLGFKTLGSIGAGVSP
jgi:LPS-assembly protein